MTDLSKNQNYGNSTPVIYLVSAHTASSPGICYGGRREAADCEELCRALEKSILSLSPEIPVCVMSGMKNTGRVKPGDLLFVFHRDFGGKGTPKKGASVFVKENACASVQYQAYSLLSAVCGEKGFRYNGVHPVTAKSPFRSLYRALPQYSFYLSAGFMGNEEDNKIFDALTGENISLLAKSITGIYKEKKYEDNTTVYKASFGGEQVKAS